MNRPGHRLTNHAMTAACVRAQMLCVLVASSSASAMPAEPA
jgi:hypothetical protein